MPLSSVTEGEKMISELVKTFTPSLSTVDAKLRSTLEIPMWVLAKPPQSMSHSWADDGAAIATPSAIALVLRICFFKGVPPHKQVFRIRRTSHWTRLGL